mmetsp:Transcript_48093/g.155166  ORF Transcript_48093/g.155166 Transcript_48093/m.155166 type:complete len:227 (+) Transcript_48093:1520-2200(+)
MSRTVLMEESMSSFMSFQAVMSVFASSFAWVWSRTSAMSSASWWQRSCASWRLWETSSIQASCALSASCMSPMSKRMVEISAVTVASTRCLEVMMEWVESTLARISSRSTFTASMAAVKSSMSRSQANTMRRMWFTSPLLLLSKSFNSPTSYLSWSKSSAMVSKPAEGPEPSKAFIEEAPRFTCDNFLSKSLCKLESWAVIWASKSCNLVETFFKTCASLLPELRP